MKSNATGDVFYVYEHWRTDKNQCFLVGKGHAGRAWSFKRRNTYHSNIVNKLIRLGLEVDVRIIKQDLSETEALAFEIERIAYWKDLGVELSNMTAGGEGVVGLKHSAETRAKIKAALNGKKRSPHSEATKLNIGKALKGKLLGRKNPEHSARLKGRRHSEETKKKMSIAQTGHATSEETKIKLRASNIGQKRSAETVQRLIDSHLGKALSEETKLKMGGYRWITDGEVSIKLRTSLLPEGFRYGRPEWKKESILKMAESQRKRISFMSEEDKSRIGKLGSAARWGSKRIADHN